MERRPAFWTHDQIHGDGGHLYYFGLTERADPPYKRQVIVSAILDIAEDGTLAGVELIDPKMPPPPNKK